jgi:hypothetical protein
MASRLLDMRDKRVSCDFRSAQRCQVVRVLLTVDGLNAVLKANADQQGQSHFGAIGDGGEHRLAKDSLAQRHKIKPSHQVPTHPEFGTVGQSHVVQLSVGFDHVGHDPSSALSFSGGMAATLNDLLEIPIKTQGKVRLK